MKREQIKELAINAVSEYHPEMKDVEPLLEMMDTSIGHSSFKKAGILPQHGKRIWVATFRKEEITEEGFPIEKIARVTLDESGKIIKISESK
ncbi:MAG: hypothetical protein U9N06_05455 [candidate division WOR-3 bacterium]|nr:hypothetical protein [candidate division WOR-3 bacterium]